MVHRCLRPLLALGVVLAAASPGLVAGAAADAPGSGVPVPVGNCWTYEPGFLTAPGDLTEAQPGAPVATWNDDVELALTSSGGTSVNRTRTFGLQGPGSAAHGQEVLAGPTLAAPTEATGGVAHYFFSSSVAGGEPEPIATPVEVEFDLVSGQTVLPLGFPEGVRGEFDLASAGEVTLALDRVVFALDAEPAWIVCNGQLSDDAEGDNPVAAPLPIDVTTRFMVLAGPRVALGAFESPKPSAVARPGDEVTLSWKGMASEGDAKVEICEPGLIARCEEVAMPQAGKSDQQGMGTATYVLPEDVTVGEKELRVTEVVPTPESDAPLDSRLAALAMMIDPLMVQASFRVLGEPTITIADDATSAEIRFGGGDWDPGVDVHVRAMDIDGNVLGAEYFPATAQGMIEGVLATDGEAAVRRIDASQVHKMLNDDGEEVLLRSQLAVDLPAVTTPTGPGDETPPVDDDPPADDPADDTPADTPTATPSAPTATTPEAAPEAEIPETEWLPVSEVTAPVDEILAADIAITDAELIGSTTFSDLFGGSPERTLRLEIENVGEAAVAAPGLQIAVGKDNPEPVFISDGVGRIEPGETVTIEVPISLPVGAFGTYNITGRVGAGDGGSFALTWETWPWGLFGLNALGALLVAWAIRRRFMSPRPALISAAAGRADPGVAVGDGEAVIDLATLEQWWALQAASAGEAADAVVDEAAVERWLDRCQARELTRQ